MPTPKTGSLYPLLLLAACARPTTSTPPQAEAPATATYVTCDDISPCADGSVCVLGLCVEECGESGEACVEGLVCQSDGVCGELCDAEHPCAPGYTCDEGTCSYDPCGHMSHWPLSIRSESHPLIVHYRDAAEEAEARRALAAVEHSWDVEIDVLGFDAPLLDGGACGPDESFDIFIWRTYRGGVSDVIGANEATPWDDYYNYLILDPWGPYGGDVLEATAAHELNHAMQAVFDWNESAIFFEMTAQFVEDQVYDDADGWQEYLVDFQQNPQWAIDYNDDYETYYMYGSTLFMFYLRDAIFDGDASFVGETWRRTSNEPGDNEPDMTDALSSVLLERVGVTFADAVTGFARWRWYTGSRDDGRHFEEGALIPDAALVSTSGRLSTVSPTISLADDAPMLLGSVYIVLERAGGESATTIAIDAAEGANWVVQAVPGLDAATDGETLDIVDGQVVVAFGEHDSRTLILTALPTDDAGYDPENRTAERYALRLERIAEP